MGGAAFILIFAYVAVWAAFALAVSTISSLALWAWALLDGSTRPRFAGTITFVSLLAVKALLLSLEILLSAVASIPRALYWMLFLGVLWLFLRALFRRFFRTSAAVSPAMRVVPPEAGVLACLPVVVALAGLCLLLPWVDSMLRGVTAS